VLIDVRISAVLVDHLGVDPRRLVGSARLEDDLGLDSLALTEVLLALEDDLVISIPDPVQAALRTLGDLVDVVASQLAQPRDERGADAALSCDRASGHRQPA
jgi:acyl carrier protein